MSSAHKGDPEVLSLEGTVVLNEDGKKGLKLVPSLIRRPLRGDLERLERPEERQRLSRYQASRGGLLLSSVHSGR